MWRSACLMLLGGILAAVSSGAATAASHAHEACTEMSMATPRSADSQGRSTRYLLFSIAASREKFERFKAPLEISGAPGSVTRSGVATRLYDARHRDSGERYTYTVTATRQIVVHNIHRGGVRWEYLIDGVPVAREAFHACRKRLTIARRRLPPALVPWAPESATATIDETAGAYVELHEAVDEATGETYHYVDAGTAEARVQEIAAWKKLSYERDVRPRRISAAAAGRRALPEGLRFVPAAELQVGQERLTLEGWLVNPAFQARSIVVMPPAFRLTLLPTPEVIPRPGPIPSLPAQEPPPPERFDIPARARIRFTAVLELSHYWYLGRPEVEAEWALQVHPEAEPAVQAEAARRFRGRLGVRLPDRSVPADVAAAYFVHGERVGAEAFARFAADVLWFGESFDFAIPSGPRSPGRFLRFYESAAHVDEWSAHGTPDSLSPFSMVVELTHAEEVYRVLDGPPAAYEIDGRPVGEDAFRALHGRLRFARAPRRSGPAHRSGDDGQDTFALRLAARDAETGHRYAYRLSVPTRPTADPVDLRHTLVRQPP